jgi:hypothetical protein
VLGLGRLGSLARGARKPHKPAPKATGRQPARAQKGAQRGVAGAVAAGWSEGRLLRPLVRHLIEEHGRRVVLRPAPVEGCRACRTITRTTDKLKRDGAKAPEPLRAGEQRVSDEEYAALAAMAARDANPRTFAARRRAAEEMATTRAGYTPHRRRTEAYTHRPTVTTTLPNGQEWTEEEF